MSHVLFEDELSLLEEPTQQVEESSVLTNEELNDYMDYVLQQTWDITCKCEAGHPYFWALHNMNDHIMSIHDMGEIGEFFDDVFEDDIDDFVLYFEQMISGMELLLRAGKGSAVPKVCEKPIVDYLRGSNRPRHLTEIVGMLAEQHGIYLDRGRVSTYMSSLHKKMLAYSQNCPVAGKPWEGGYWQADDVDPAQAIFDFDMDGVEK